MSEHKGTENLIPVTQRTKEEAKELSIKGGKASGEARRRKRDMRELLKAMLEEPTPKGDSTYAERITKSLLTVASNPKNGGAAVNAYSKIMHIIGQEDPEPRNDAIQLLAEILKENRKSAELSVKPEAEGVHSEQSGEVES